MTSAAPVALGGALTMAAFGLGTLPMLLTMGSAATLVARLARATVVRRTAAALIMAFAVLQFVHVGQAWAEPASHGHHACCPSQRS